MSVTSYAMNSPIHKLTIITASAVFVAFGLLFVPSAYAEQIISVREPPNALRQLNHLNGATGPDSVTNDVSDYGNGGTSSGVEVDITGIQLYVGCISSEPTMTGFVVRIWDIDDSKYIAELTADSENDVVCSVGTGSPSLDDLVQVFVATTTAFDIPSGHDYWVVLGKGSQANAGLITLWVGDQGSGNYSYSLYNDIDPAPALGWNTPTDMYVGVDFASWRLDTFNLNEALTYGLNIYYSTPDESILYDYQDSFNGYSGSASIFGLSKSHSLFQPLLGENTTWSVYAELLSASGAVLDTTDTITIDIIGYGTVTSTLPGSVAPLPSSLNPHTGFGESGTDVNSTSSVWFVDCSSYQFIDTYFGAIPFLASSSMNAIVCGAKKTSFAIAGWLFVPPEWATDLLVSSLDFSDVFPFSLVIGVANTVNDFALVESQSTTTAYSATTLSLPQIGLSAQLLTSSTLKDSLVNANCDNACANDFKEDIFNAERAIIWIGAVIAMIVMFI